MEWQEKHKYSSFNSYKGLCYYERYKAIDKWLNGKGNLPPPIEVSIDPIAQCNLKCYYCNSQRYLRDAPITSKPMKRQLLRELIREWAHWGIEGFCFGGGGESLLNKDIWCLPSWIAGLGKESSVVTNGTIMNDTLTKELCYCRWVGISVDAATSETYAKVHGVDGNILFKVLDNIKALVTCKKKESWSKVDIAYKFLILPENIHEIAQACSIAKSLGVNDFHARPADLERKDYKGKRAEYSLSEIKAIEEEYLQCQAMTTDNFRVFTVSHKFDPELHVEHKFQHCYASPLVLQACTDGNAYVCVDHRIEPRFLLGQTAKVKEWWGKEKHRELIKSIQPNKECSRCTWSEYNLQIEEVIQKDSMCVKFP